MNKAKTLLKAGAWLVTTIMVVSCASTGFKSSEVNLELRFYRWDSVCIARPDTRENGFSVLFTADEVARQIEQLQVGRQLAAVVVGYSYDDQQVREIGRQWQERLTRQGFERVVVFRGADHWPIAKLPIVYDSAISSGHETQEHLRPNAATPSAPRADAAHPSVATVW